MPFAFPVSLQGLWRQADMCQKDTCLPFKSQDNSRATELEVAPEISPAQGFCRLPTSQDSPFHRLAALTITGSAQLTCMSFPAILVHWFRLYGEPEKVPQLLRDLKADATIISPLSFGVPQRPSFQPPPLVCSEPPSGPPEAESDSDLSSHGESLFHSWMLP